MNPLADDACLVCGQVALVTDDEGYHCTNCGDKQVVAWFLRYATRRAVMVEEKARAKTAARKAAKSKAPVQIAPKVAAYFTDDPTVVGQVGKVWTCEKCKNAPPKYRDYPNTWKWKTERGFLNHKCLGGAL